MSTYTVSGCPCCGHYNLLKIDPSTGAIVWSTLVPGPPSGGMPNPDAYRVCALKGTNDVMVSNGYQTLSRVDSTGSQVWHYDSLSPGYGNIFAVDGTNSAIIAIGNAFGGGDTISGLSYSGSVNWSGTTTSLDFPGGSSFDGVACGGGKFVGSAGGAQFGATTAPSVLWGFDTSFTGFGDGVSGAGLFLARAGVMAMDSGGGFVDSVAKYDAATGILISSATLPNAQFGAGGYTSVFSGTFLGTGGTGVTPSTTVTSISGHALASLRDSCSESGPNYYFTGALISGIGDIFKVDASGSLIWAQTYNTIGAATATGMCISDDGYLYVAGTYV